MPEPTKDCESLKATRDREGASAMLDQLTARLIERGEFRALLDALLLKARFDLGLPAVQAGPLARIPEPERSRYEERYVEAIREVGSRFLNAGDIPSAWPFFRAISEPEPVARAIDSYAPKPEGDEQLGAIIEVAFHHGANPLKGYELILDHYGICNAISSFEGLPQDESIRVPSVERLVKHLHEHLTFSLRADIERQGKPMPDAGASIARIVADRPWLFDDDAYHVDISHLGAVVRLSVMLTGPDSLRQAIDLTEYGRRLSHRHQYESDPPFERLYDDHGVYLRALAGEDVDAAIAHFRGKLPKLDAGDEAEGEIDSTRAQVLVRLLCRLNRNDEAIDVAAEHLAGIPEGALACPSLAQLCERAGRLDRLEQSAAERGDLVQYAAAILRDSPKPLS